MILAFNSCHYPIQLRRAREAWILPKVALEERSHEQNLCKQTTTNGLALGCELYLRFLSVIVDSRHAHCTGSGTDLEQYTLEFDLEI